MSDNRIDVIFSPFFTRELKQLRKTHRRLDQDVEPLVTQLEQGETPGDRLQGLSPLVVYKVRLASREAQRGKSGGYRLVYYVRTSTQTILVSIYPKTQQEDIANRALRDLLAEIEAALDTPVEAANDDPSRLPDDETD